MLEKLVPRKVTGPWSATKSNPLQLKLPIKYSFSDWDISTRTTIRISADQERFAETLTDETKRLLDEVNENTNSWQGEVEHQLRERLAEVRFLYEELTKQRKTGCQEAEALDTYRLRLIRALDNIQNALNINHKCLALREKRIGIDLCDDLLNQQLMLELKVMKGSQNQLEKTLKRTIEQLRGLRAAIYELDNDLEQKGRALQIDEKNLNLKETRQGLGKGFDLYSQMCINTLPEWQEITAENLKRNTKELNMTAELRAYIDLLLKQVFEDLRNQIDRTNDAFRHRIAETRAIKHCMEQKLAECTTLISGMMMGIHTLETEIAGRENSLKLCQTRLSNRSQRSGQELTCDWAQQALYDEQNNLQCSLVKLKQKLIENKATKRYLNHTQVIQSEEINIKANTLNIDEVECMTLRGVLQFKPF